MAIPQIFLCFMELTNNGGWIVDDLSEEGAQLYIAITHVSYKDTVTIMYMKCSTR